MNAMSYSTSVLMCDYFPNITVSARGLTQSCDCVSLSTLQLDVMSNHFSHSAGTTCIKKQDFL